MTTSTREKDRASSFSTSDRDMRELKRKVDRYRLRELPVETLERMDRQLAERQEELLETAREQSQSLEEALRAGRGLIIGELRARVRRASKEHRELGQERAKIHDARQQRVLEDRLITILGSKARVSALEWLIIALIIGVVSLLLYDLSHPELPDSTRRLIGYIDIGACLVFLAEFFFRHHHAESKRWFWRRHWIDFITSIPIPNAQMVRFGRLMRLARLSRLVRLARLLRVLRVIFFFWRGMDKLQDVLDVKLMKRSLAITVSILLIGAGLIWVSESGSGDSRGVASFSESVWWSFTTVVTGGFGDIHNPTTLAGRVVTVVLIIAGMIVVGIFIATLTSVLVGDESELLLARQKEISERVDQVVLLVQAMANTQGLKQPAEGDPGRGPDFPT